MMYLWTCFVSLLMAAIGCYLLKKLEVCDNDSFFHFNRRDTIFFAIFLNISLIVLIHKNEKNLDFQLIYICFFFWHLYLTAWMDFHTMKVYRSSSVVICFLGMMNLIFQNPSMERIIGLILYIICMFVFAKKNLFGAGDSGIFMAVALCLASLEYQNFTITILLIHNIFSSVIFIILNARHIQFCKMKLKKEIAFAPSIAIAAWIMIVLCF